MRILCVYIPGFPTHSTPHATGRPPALPDPGSPEEVVNSLWDDILSSLKSFTIRIESPVPGTAYLDVTKPLQIYTDEEVLGLSIIQMILMSFHLEAQVGVSNSRFTAHGAALFGTAISIVPPGKEKEFLGPLPMEALPLEEEIKERLKLLGLSTCRKIARLSRAALLSQFGATGKEMWDLVNGVQDKSRIPPVRTVTCLEREDVFDAPMETTAQLHGCVATIVEEMASELAHLKKRCRRLKIVLHVRNAPSLQRIFTFHVPTSSGEEMARRILYDLEQVTLEGPVTGVFLAAHVLSPREVIQDNLFRPRPLSFEKLKNVRGYLRAKYGAIPLARVAEEDEHTFLPEKRYRFVEL